MHKSPPKSEYSPDSYDILGIDPNKEEDRIRFTADGLHFNDTGHAVLAERLIQFLKELLNT